jgi:hypothetical protein
MKLYQILIFILFVFSCSKDIVDTSPKKVIKCSDWAFDYYGEKLNQIYYTKGSDYKIKFIYNDSIITNIEYYSEGQLETRTYLIYDNGLLKTEIDTTYQEYNRYEQIKREYKYLNQNEVELKISSNNWNDTILKVNYIKKYSYKNENLVQIIDGNRTDKIEYDNHINPFYNIIGLKRLRYFTLRGETILLNSKNNCIKFNSLVQTIEYSSSNQPIKYLWSKDLYEQYSY